MICRYLNDYLLLLLNIRFRGYYFYKVTQTVGLILGLKMGLKVHRIMLVLVL